MTLHYSRPRNWKRTLFKVGVFLLLGAVVNVAVAATCLLYSRFKIDPFGYRRISPVDRDWLDSICPSRSGAAWNSVWPIAWAEGRGVQCHVFLSDIPANDRGAGWFEALLISRTRCGWPCNALQGIVISHGERNARSTGGSMTLVWNQTMHYATELTQDARPRPDFVEPSIPLGPIWPGFAINTIFYAALLWVLWITSGKVRRWIRVRRSQCPACGHIIAAGTCANGLCSECGSPLPEGFKPKPDASAQT